MSKCDLDKCQLTDDVAEIKLKQQEMHDSTIRMEMSQDALVEKIDDYIENGKEDHKELFKRTRWAITWPGLGAALGSASIALTVILKIMGVW
jgi:hypothetical protein